MKPKYTFRVSAGKVTIIHDSDQFQQRTTWPIPFATFDKRRLKRVVRRLNKSSPRNVNPFSTPPVWDMRCKPLCDNDSALTVIHDLGWTFAVFDAVEDEYSTWPRGCCTSCGDEFEVLLCKDHDELCITCFYSKHHQSIRKRLSQSKPLQAPDGLLEALHAPL